MSKRVSENVLGRCFIFLIRENWRILLETGLTGFKILPAEPKFTVGMEIFVAVSGIGVFGPFIIKATPYAHDDLRFYRLYHDDVKHLWGQPVLTPTAYLLELKPTPDANLKRPLMLIRLEEMLDNPDVWHKIYAIQLTEEQHQAIRAELISRKPQPATS